MSIENILRKTSESDEFREYLDRRHLVEAADKIEQLLKSKDWFIAKIDCMQRELDMIKAENEYLKNKPGVR